VSAGVGHVLLFSEDFEDLLKNFVEQLQFILSMGEVRQRMAKDHRIVEILIRWYDTR
jgi:hypothetical protein